LSDGVFDAFSGWFCGKASPLQLYWHSLISRPHASTVFAHRLAPMPAPVTQDAYSHEVISFGFWPGDQHGPEPSYYSYTPPSRPTCV
jgi:Family of unknown function (DUF5996)